MEVKRTKYGVIVWDKKQELSRDEWIDFFNSVEPKDIVKLYRWGGHSSLEKDVENRHMKKYNLSKGVYNVALHYLFTKVDRNQMAFVDSSLCERLVDAGVQTTEEAMAFFVQEYEIHKLKLQQSRDQHRFSQIERRMKALENKVKRLCEK